MKYLQLFFSVLLLGFVACENDVAKIKLITSKSTLPEISSHDITIYYSDSGQVQARLTSPQMDNFTSKKPVTEFPKGIHVVFFDPEMKIQSSLTSNYAIKREAENKMEAKDNVVVVNEKGEQLNTEHLIWDETRAKIFSDAFVKITTADEIIYGTGFEANQDFTQYKIFKINGTINLKKD